MSHFYLRVAPSSVAKVIVAVSKKVSNKAAVRNRIRRRIRPMIRKFIPNLKPATYFIIARPGSEKIKGKELENELRLLVVSCQR